MLTGYQITEYLEPSWYYDYNISRIYSYVYHKLILRHNKILEEHKKEELMKTRRLKELEREKKLKDIRTLVKIKKINKSRNPFQNNALSLRIEYEISNTGETFADYLTDSKSELLQYKLARFLLATTNHDFDDKDIFDKDFESFCKYIMGKELFVDLNKKNNKISVELFLHEIFYKNKSLLHHFIILDAINYLSYILSYTLSCILLRE